MQSAGLPAPTFSLEGMFTVTFLRPVANITQWLHSLMPPVTELKADILRYLHERPEATLQEMASEFNLTSRTIERCVKSLRERGLLNREGSRKNGRYIIQFYP